MITIHGVEATQAIQYFSSPYPVCGTDPSRHPCADNSIPLVAGKATSIRVFVSASSGMQLYGFGVKFEAGDSAPQYFYPSGGVLTNPPLLPLRTNAGHSLNILIPPQASVGQWRLGISVFDNNAGMPASIKSTMIDLNFVPRALVRMRLVRMRYAGMRNGVQMNIPAPTLAEFWQNADFLQRVYPVALPGIELVRETEEVFDGAFTTRWDSDDPAEIGTTGTLWDIMFRLHATEGLSDDVVYCALYPDAAGANGGGAAGKFIVSPMGYSDYLAHEVGHACGLPHAPSPAAVLAGYTDPTYPQYGMNPGGSIGEVGFRPVTGVVFNPATTYDMMAYDGPPWISPHNYLRLFDCVGSPKLPTVPPLLPEIRDRPEYFLCYWMDGPAGDLLKKVCGPHIPWDRPWWPPTKSHLLPFEVKLLGADNQVLASGAFAPQPIYPPRDGKMYQAFRVRMPWNPDARRIELQLEGKVVDSRPVSVTPPKVKGAIELPDKKRGSISITWDVASKEELQGTYVRASVDGGNSWTAFNVAFGARQLNIATDFLPVGESVLVQIFAVAGMRTGSWTSERLPLTVGRSGLMIVRPQGKLSVGRGDAVELIATMHHGSGSEEIIWSSDRDGELGIGAHLVVVSLSPGSHKISARLGPCGTKQEAAVVDVARGDTKAC